MRAALIAFALGVAVATFGPDVASRAVWELLPDCPAEDSSNCRWNASTRGDGNGQSFFDVAGYAFDVDAN